MRKFFGVFGDLFLFNSRFDAGKHFYDNAVLRPLRFFFIVCYRKFQVGA